MLRREYHCFVAGLADLVFDSGKNIVSMMDFREELKRVLHPSDYSKIVILFLPADNRNLVSFLSGVEELPDPLGTYTLQEFAEQKRIIHSILKEDIILPRYMVEFMTDWLNSEDGIEELEADRRLTEGYINTALNSGNRFLEKWIRFDRDLNNIFTLINSKMLGLNAVNLIIGDDPLAAQLREIYSSGKDFQVPAEPEYAPMIFKIAVESEFLEREKKTDIARWDFIDSETFFEYFTIDMILGYTIKLSVVNRWKMLDPETGKMMLDRLIKDMETPVLSGTFIN
ncbi:MAG TPA: hypothetical protein DDW27_05725 [Bacteroidales bacterium]|nr:hypothetical protein [Bacteroidales bacterium]